MNQFNFDETERPYYMNDASTTVHQSPLPFQVPQSQPQPQPQVQQQPKQSNSTSDIDNFNQIRASQQPVDTTTTAGAVPDPQSVDSLKQQQAANPYLQRMQQLREQQQKKIEEQLRNQQQQQQNQSFNQKNVVIDSDV